MRALYEGIRAALEAQGSDVALAPAATLPGAPLAPVDLPISAALAHLGPSASETEALVDEARAAASGAAWRQPYAPEDFGPAFAAGVGWFPVADREGPLVLEDALVEIMLLASGVRYPPHSHAPEEVYLVLAGALWWEAEGDPAAPAWRRAGAVLHHPPHRRHALTAAADGAALVATVWTGGGFEMPRIG